MMALFPIPTGRTESGIVGSQAKDRIGIGRLGFSWRIQFFSRANSNRLADSFCQF
jgi:hypothetical protein